MMQRYSISIFNYEFDCHAEMSPNPEGEWVRYEDAVQPHFLLDLCEILGWQGGTIHQALAEVKRLKVRCDAGNADALHINHKPLPPETC